MRIMSVSNSYNQDHKQNPHFSSLVKLTEEGFMVHPSKIFIFPIDKAIDTTDFRLGVERPNGKNVIFRYMIGYFDSVIEEISAATVSQKTKISPIMV